MCRLINVMAGMRSGGMGGEGVIMILDGLRGVWIWSRRLLASDHTSEVSE